ncbi:MAG: hypothetical protein JW896_09340 [Deltaproteobacteria bacterium]|nr:hypothetical protein [Deltaproteobacteria bacterium]
MEARFIADSTLGRLAKWLRVMGYDTIYQSFYKTDDITEFVREGRILLSRQQAAITHYPSSLMIRSDHLEAQLHEMKHMGAITPDKSRWFSRCLICNMPLEVADTTVVLQNVPEHVIYQSPPVIQFCPSCNRHFWPGSHRERMKKQLEEWGF